MSIFTPFNNAKKLINGAKKMFDNVNYTDDNDENKSIFDPFIPKMPYEKSFRFTETSFIYGDTEYPYETLNPFKFQSMTDSKFIKGVVSTVTSDQKNLNVGFELYQSKRIIKATNYANEQIIKAKGGTVGYKFLIQANDASKIEVYEDSIHLSVVSSGFANAMKSGFSGGAQERILHFNDTALTLSGNSLCVSTGDTQFVLPLDQENTTVALEAIEYINSVNAAGGFKRKEPASRDIPWQAYTGKVRTFSLGDGTFTVSAALDIHNRYRKIFRDYALECMECFKEEFNKRVYNLTSYMDVFPELYAYYLSSVTDKALEIAISENIWSLTRESLMESHLENFHMGMDDIMITYESVALTLEKNQQDMAKLTSIIPNLQGGGFGFKGAVKGIATATAFNLIRDGVEDSMINAAAGINYAQQVELYNRVNTDILFNNVFSDYMNMYLTLIGMLRSNGKDIWDYDQNIALQNQNIFKNLSNPNFPKEQVSSTFMNILSSNPYEPAYITFMKNYYGENEQTRAIEEYFN